MTIQLFEIATKLLKMAIKLS